MGRIVAVVLLALISCERERNRPPSVIRDAAPRDEGVGGDGGDRLDGSDGVDGSVPVDGSDPRDGGDPRDGSDPLDGSDPRDASSPDLGSIRLCQQACSGPVDCVPNDNALQDADNWSCNAGHCEYLGCLSSSECTAVFGAGYACIQFAGQPLAGCVETCLNAGDCASVGSPLFDVDNYDCENSGCRWLGCNGDDECRTVFNDPIYVCEVQSGLPNCIRPCSGVSDCATTTPAFDGDNYSCTDQRCRYLGCQSDSECAATFTPGVWECLAQ
jgi:hypothetical protein